MRLIANVTGGKCYPYPNTLIDRRNCVTELQVVCPSKFVLIFLIHFRLVITSLAFSILETYYFEASFKSKVMYIKENNGFK